MFAWLRPTDLVWRYWVNNYVEGKSPAAFDVLFWNADTTRMAAALHRDMVTMGLHNSLVTPGAVSMLGTPVDLNQVTTDAYVVAGIADHISPWQACYRSARLLGIKDLRFVLSSSGHIASLVNPPGNPKANYRVAEVDEPDPAFWLESAEKHTGFLVAGLRRLARRAQWREEGCPGGARWRRHGAAGARSRHLRVRTLNIERACMTTVFEEPADLLKLVGQRLGTTEWMQITQDQVDRFADATGDKQWIHTDPQRAAKGPFKGTIAHGYLTLALTPAVISQVLQIRELTAALNYGLNKVRFPTPLPVGSQVRAAVTVMSAQQKTSGVESVFTLTYEIDGEERPACVADVIVLYP